MPSTPSLDPTGALPIGTRVAEFEIRRVLGEGGFGIVYLAFDHALEREVAVKEYMPSSLAGRDTSLAVSVRSESHVESFTLGLRSFVNEARLLARFDHPALLKVYRYWEANRTAYMAMRYYGGRNLHQVRRAMAQAPDEAWIRAVIQPLLGALECLHIDDVYHRDISPDNVLIEANGQPVLLDFGAARRVITDKSMALTAVLKPAYAPIEQYGESPSLKQGPWTDLYALGATIYFLLVGRPPPPATSRVLSDELLPLGQRGLSGYSPVFLACVDWMLRPRPADRPQTVAALRSALAGERAIEPPAGPSPLPASAPAASDSSTGVSSADDSDYAATVQVSPPTPVPPPPAAVAPATRWVPTHKLTTSEVAAAGRPRRAKQTPAANSTGWRWGAGAVAAVLLALPLGWQLLKPGATPRQADDAAQVAGEVMPGASAAGMSSVTAPAPASAPDASAILAVSPATEARSEPASAATRPSPMVVPTPQTSPQTPSQRTARMPATASAGPASATPTPSQASISVAPVVAAERAPEPVAPAPVRPAPRPQLDDGDAMVVRSRQLSPSELCQDSNVLLKWACIKRQCDALPALKNNPECVQARQEH